MIDIIKTYHETKEMMEKLVADKEYNKFSLNYKGVLLEAKS